VFRTCSTRFSPRPCGPESPWGVFRRCSVGSRESELTDRRNPCKYVRADGETRTPDPFITSEVLYQLSYVGVRRTPSVRSRGGQPMLRGPGASQATSVGAEG
jgi:hypothetical protein